MAVQKALVLSAGGIRQLQTPDSVKHVGKKNLGGSTLTIASGVITVTTSYHIIDTEGAGASDDLVTINGGVDGDIVMFSAAHDARSIVFKTTGNIITGLGDATLDTDKDVFIFRKHNNSWIFVGIENN